MTSSVSTPAHTGAFHALTVSGVQQLTDDAVEIAFGIPTDVQEAFAFRPGQHVTVRIHRDGEELRRSYSITNQPDEGEIRIGVRRAEGGLVSGHLVGSVRAGDSVEVMPPAGRFCADVHAGLRRHWLFIAAGSGITPVLSLMRQVLRDESRATITLLYVNRTLASTMFRRELDALKNQHLDRISVVHFLTRERRNAGLLDGRLTPDALRSLVGPVLPLGRTQHAFICGPQAMTEDLSATLADLGLEPGNIHTELFLVDGERAPHRAPVVRADSAAVAHATVRLHGVESQIDLYEGERVLDAARRSQLDTPFSCTGGVCATCRAYLEEGSVEMAANYALATDEVEAGYILTCQASPTSSELVVDFDRP